MDIRKITLASVTYTIISQLVHMIGAIFSMSYYTDPAYLQVWSKLMMPTNGPPPTEFVILSLLIGFIGAVLIAYIYEVLKKSMPSKSKWAFYGMVLFALGTAPGIMAMMLLINIPAGLGMAWLIEGLLINVIGAMAIVRICGP